MKNKIKFIHIDWARYEKGIFEPNDLYGLNGMGEFRFIERGLTNIDNIEFSLQGRRSYIHGYGIGRRIGTSAGKYMDESFSWGDIYSKGNGYTQGISMYLRWQQEGGNAYNEGTGWGNLIGFEINEDEIEWKTKLIRERYKN